jgi:hypothetical protein
MDKIFEDFLKDWHAKDYIGIDDDMPDAYDNWTADLQVDSLIRLADIFARESYLRGFDRAKTIALETINPSKT